MSKILNINKKDGDFMLYSYEECLQKFNTHYQISKALKNEKLFRLEPGIYSDKKYESDTAVIRKKYPKSVFTLNSAFYYQSLTDTIPLYYYLATDKNYTKISNKKVKQIFDNCNSLNIGVEKLNYCNDEILVFSKERLLIELIRNKSKLPFDYYKEIINNYRKMIYELDFQIIEEYAEYLPKTKLVMNTIQMEVF